MAYQNTFKRYELKYLISKEQKKAILKAMDSKMKLDAYGRSLICNIYFDTPDYLLVRRSMEKPIYKEKLRLRSYGVASQDSPVFVELKKKYQGVVYKRRISTNYRQAWGYLCEQQKLPVTSQISREIDYFKDWYRGLSPAVYLSYEREAFYGLEDSELRVTFDENILWRRDHLDLCANPYGERIIDSDQTLMEIKIAGAMPLWFSRALSENKIFQCSFSKYGTAYAQMLKSDGKKVALAG